MNTGAPDLLSQIDDIRGLDPIGWWPLAPGWWAVIGVALAAVLAVAAWRLRLRARERSWKGDAARELANLERRLSPESSQEITGSLSAILRRIAMRLHSRQECAGLEGQAWLAWLRDHDRRGFDWVARGRVLIDVPYAPPGAQAPVGDIELLIQAARRWVA